MFLKWVNTISCWKRITDAAENPADFLSGQLRPLKDSVAVKEDCVYQYLTEPNDEYDHHCIAILAVILPALAQYVSTKFRDYLPEEKFTGLWQKMYDKTQSVEKHNTFSEYVFTGHITSPFWKRQSPV